MLIQALRSGVTSILEALRPRLVQTMRSAEVEDSQEAMDTFAQPLWEATLRSRQEAFALGLRFAGDQAAEFGYRPPDVPTPGYAPQSVRTVIRENWRGQQPWEKVADALELHVRDASRQAVISSVDAINADESNTSPVDDSEQGLDEAWADLDAQMDADPDDAEGDVVTTIRPRVTWSRVLGANDNHCAFCVMLAARGPVFSSSEEAGIPGSGAVSQSEFWPGPDWENRFHTNCQCGVVMVPRRGKWAGAAQVRALESFYKEAQRRLRERGVSPASGKHYRTNVMLQEIDQMLRERAEDGSPVEIPEYAA